MSIASATTFLESLIHSNLLDSHQHQELVRTLADLYPDPRKLAGELIGRGWLTSFQSNELFRGKGDSLRLGPYVLLERIGEGGMGQVFKARHVNLQRIVALKILHANLLDNDMAVRRFLREARTAGRLTHPNIVLAFDANQLDGRHYFAMEYVKGMDLAKQVKLKGPLKAPQACDYVRQAALGLQYAFEQGMVHRDIKPANLLVAKTTEAQNGCQQRPAADPRSTAAAMGRWGQVKILDMGLARICKDDPHGSTELTKFGSILGTPDFIAPEQARDSQCSDIRSDLYSLGCTLYFLLTGSPPFPDGTVTERLLHHQLDEPEPVEEVRRRELLQRGANPKELKYLSSKVGGLVRRLMAKSPEERFQTPAELAESLTILLSQGQSSSGMRPVSFSKEELSPKPKRRPPPERPTARTVPSAAARTAGPEHITPPPDLAEPILQVNVPRPRRPGIYHTIFLVLVAVFVLLVGIALVPKLLQMANSNPESETGSAGAEADWRNLVRQMCESPQDVARNWDLLAQFRMKHHGTMQARFAQRLCLRIPSPLDRLDPADIPKMEEFPWQPKQLVAVFGRRLNPLLESTRAVAVSPTARFVAVSWESAGIALFDAVHPQNKFTFSSFSDIGLDQAATLAFSPDGRWLAVGTTAGFIKVWDCKRRKLKVEYGASSATIRLAAFLPDGKRLLSVGADDEIHLRDIQSNKHTVLDDLFSHRHRLDTVLSPNGKTLASICEDGTVEIFTFINDKLDLAQTLDYGKGRIPTALAFHPNNRALIVAAGNRGSLHMYRLQANRFKLVRKLAEHGSEVRSVTFAPGGGALVSAGLSGRIVQWSAATGRRLNDWALRRPVVEVEFAADGRHLIAANRGGAVYILRLAPPALVPALAY